MSKLVMADILTKKELEISRLECHTSFTFGGETYILTERDIRGLMTWIHKGSLDPYESEGLIFNVESGGLSIDDFDGGYIVVDLTKFIEEIDNG